MNLYKNGVQLKPDKEPTLWLHSIGFGRKRKDGHNILDIGNGIDEISRCNR